MKGTINNSRQSHTELIILGRLALGAKLSTSQPSTQFQNRMNRKMGISPINGTHKLDIKKSAVNGKSTDGLVNSNEKRKAGADSDSEEDSKSRLIKKLSSKKLELTQSSNKKKSNSKSTVHTAITQTSPKASITSPTQHRPPTVSVSTDNVSSNNAQLQRNGINGETPSIPNSTDSQILNDFQAADDDGKEDAEKQERKRLKREKKKEQRRLKKLEKREEST